MDQAITTCAHCGYGIRSALFIRLKDDSYGQVAYGETHYSSGLYNPSRAGKFTLCEKCHEHEQKMIDEVGTNDIPELLATYTPSVQR